jgi:hypothetical protein
MNKVSSGGLIALMVLVLPAAGEAAAAKYPAPNCKEKCEVTVMVAGNSCGAGIAVAPEPIVTDSTAPVTINWKVIGDWEFDVNGINTAEGFTATKTKEGYTVTVSAKTKGVVPYEVNLVRKGKPSEKCSRDPTIINH